MKTNTKIAITAFVLVITLFTVFGFIPSMEKKEKNIIEKPIVCTPCVQEKQECPLSGPVLGANAVDLSTLNVNEKALIQVKFFSETKYGKFDDAIYFTEDEFNNTTKEERELKEQERIDKWIQIVSTPPKKTSEEVQSEIDAINIQLNQLQNPEYIRSQVDSLTAQLSEKQADLQIITNQHQ